MKRHRLSIAITIVIFVTAAYVLGWSSLLTVSSIEISGTKTVVTTEVKVGERLARIEPRKIAAELERIRWIKSVEVSRDWIGGKVSIFIIARTPIAIFNDQAIDEDGISFPLLNQNIQGLPRIQAPDIATAVATAHFYNSLPQDFAQSISILRSHSGDSYSFEIGVGQKSIEVFWGQNEENSLKVRVYKALIARPENLNVKRIELSAPHAPIVK